MNPSDPDTILTSMYKVRSMIEETGQTYTLFTADQQLYRIIVHLTWWKPHDWKHCVPTLGEMVSFVGSIDILMANSGLAPVLKSAFGGVEKILSGKKFPQNMRAL